MRATFEYLTDDYISSINIERVGLIVKKLVVLLPKIC